MLSLIVSSVLLALVAAQGQQSVKSTDEGITFRVKRDGEAYFMRETTAVFAGAGDLAALEKEVLEEVSASASDVYADALGISSDTATALEARQKKVETQVNGLTDSLDDYVTMEQFEKDMSDMKALHDKEIDDLMKEINDLTKAVPSYAEIQSFVADEKKNVDSKAAKYKTSVESEVTKQLAALTTRFNNIKSTAVLRAGSKLPLWRGACSKHGGKGKMERYCLDRQLESTANDVLSISSDKTKFIAKVDGYFRINYMAIQEACQYGVNELVVGDKTVWSGKSYQQNLWQDVFIDQTWPVKKGEEFYVQANSGCGNRWGWHSGDSTGSHSVIQVMLMSYM
eukprot:m.334774 g.334774  ORF g.334774 m.334774 type:complete len:340 (+) comp17434_c0_seq1:77-1096(+)